MWFARFGNSGTGSGQAVPEPAGILLWVFFGVAAAGCRRRKCPREGLL
jgi:hypothetical protein